MNTRDYRESPTAEFKYFLYDPEWHGMKYFRCIEDRDQAAIEAIEGYFDDEWGENVTSVCVGEVTGIAALCDPIGDQCIYHVEALPHTPIADENEIASSIEVEDSVFPWLIEDDLYPCSP